MNTANAHAGITTNPYPTPSTPLAAKKHAALCADVESAYQSHREHCLLLTVNCPICQALADLDALLHREYHTYRS